MRKAVLRILLHCVQHSTSDPQKRTAMFSTFSYDHKMHTTCSLYIKLTFLSLGKQEPQQRRESVPGFQIFHPSLNRPFTRRPGKYKMEV